LSGDHSSDGLILIYRARICYSLIKVNFNRANSPETRRQQEPWPRELGFGSPQMCDAGSNFYQQCSGFRCQVSATEVDLPDGNRSWIEFFFHRW